MDDLGRRGRVASGRFQANPTYLAPPLPYPQAHSLQTQLSGPWSEGSAWEPHSAASRTWILGLSRHASALELPGPEPALPSWPVLYPLATRSEFHPTLFNKDTGLSFPPMCILCLFMGSSEVQDLLWGFWEEGTQRIAGKKNEWVRWARVEEAHPWPWAQAPGPSWAQFASSHLSRLSGPLPAVSSGPPRTAWAGDGEASGGSELGDPWSSSSQLP